MATSTITVLSSAAMRRTKVVLCLIVAACLGLLLDQMLKHPSAVVDGYAAVVSLGILAMLIGMARGTRAGFYLSDRGVVARMTFSTRSWDWRELDRVESMDLTSRGGPMGILAATTQRTEPRIQIIPVFHLAAGRTVVLRGLRTSSTSSYEPNWLDDALDAVNDRIEEHRTGGRGSGAPPRPS